MAEANPSSSVANLQQPADEGALPDLSQLSEEERKQREAERKVLDELFKPLIEDSRAWEKTMTDEEREK